MTYSRIRSILAGVVILAVAAVAGRTVGQTFAGKGRIADTVAAFRIARSWETLATAGSQIGSGDGSLTIVEFSDFQCPFCARSVATIDSLLARYPTRLKIQYRHLPLAKHEFAVAAAEAAECANEQGLFKQYHDALFAAQDSIGIVDWGDLAQRAGIRDIGRFDACVGERRHRARVQSDLAAADKLGIAVTPTFIINGEVIRGAVPASTLERLLSP